MNSMNKLRRKVKDYSLLLVLLAVLMSLFGVKAWVQDAIIKIGFVLIIGMITSGVTEIILEKFGLNMLKKYSIPLDILGVKFSLTVFVIVSLISEKLLFG